MDKRINILQNQFVKLKSQIFRYRDELFDFGKRKRILGKSGVSYYDFIEILIERIEKSAFDLRAFGMAYNFFLAFFPTLIVLILLLPYLPIENFQNKLVEAINGVLPEYSHELVNQAVYSTFRDSDIGLILLTLITTVFFASRGTRFMIRAFRDKSELHKHRSFLREYILGITLYLTLIFWGIFSMALFQLTDVVKLYFETQQFYLTGWIMFVFYIIEIILIALTLFSVLSIIYRLAPNVSKSFHFITEGGVVAAILLMALQVLLRIYFANFANYNKLFGSLTAVMVLLIWFYYMSAAILLGYEINIAIRKAKNRTTQT